MTEDERLTRDCLRVISEEKCIHGMTFEYCAVCQRRTYQKVVKFPIERKDANGKVLLDSNGNPKKMWLDTEVTREWYMRYR